MKKNIKKFYQQTRKQNKNVENAKGEENTIAEILVQNKIDYTPKISVIIPVYNVEEYLRECLDSVVNQTLKEIEIICVDDGSTDNSLEILKEYAQKDKRFTVIAQKNQGSGKARNNAIDNAKGEFIAFMDSDDMYPNEKTLEHLYNKAIENNVIICGGSLSQLREGGIIVSDPKEFEKGYCFETEGIVNYSDYQFDYGYWRFIYNRQFLKENQLYFPDYLRQQDPPFFVKTMAIAEKFYAVKETTYVYRISYKKIQWNERKTVDLFKGIRDCLVYSSHYNLQHLHARIAGRLNIWTFRTAAATMVDNQNVRNQILETLDTVDYNLLEKENISLELDDIYKAIIQAKENGIIVSVIIPCYNVEKYLARCLDSVINQTFHSMEILCVNDGSTDGTLEILKEYEAKDKRIRIIDKANGGLSSARNAGVAEAKGFFINFIDSDDWIDVTTIEKAVTKMSGPVDLVCWGAEIVNEGLDEYNGGIYVGKEYHKIKITGQKEMTEDVILKSSYTVWNKLFKKHILDEYKIEFADGRLFEDNDYSIMYMMHCRQGYYLDEYLYYYVQRPGSIMEKLRAGTCNRTSDNLYIFDNLYQHFKKHDLLEKYKKLIAVRFSIHLRAAYRGASSELKESIRQQAKALSKSYRKDLFWNNIIENLKTSKFFKIRELNQIIVSLTSFPARIKTVHQTIKTLLTQSLKADQVILWLAPEQFPNKERDLPQELLCLKEKGLTIDWYHDIRSYKKLIPTLKKYPEAIIVTADDDILYPVNWIEELYKEYCEDTKTIWCHRARRINLREKAITSYKTWSLDVTKNIPCYLNFCTSGGGVLYPPHCFHSDILNENQFMLLAPQADDIWLWAMLVMNNKKINVVNNNMKFLNLVEGTQETALWHSNVEGKNDEQFMNVLKAYPDIIKKLRKEEYINKIKIYLSFFYPLIYWVKQKIKSFNAQITEIKQNLQEMRIDVKNFGTSDNNIVVTGKNIKTNKSKWLTDEQGVGTVVETSNLKQKLTINIVKDGILQLIFRGQDKKNSQGVRKKVWIDYQSIKIDGKEILSSPVKTWHDEPYRYEMAVKDEQIVNVEIKQIPHQYDQNELKWLIKLFNPNLPNLDKVSKIVHRKFKYRGGLFYQKQTKEHKKIYICGIQVYNARMRGAPMNKKTVKSSLLQRIMQKAKSLNPSSKEIEQTLQKMRIDVKNYGASDNDIVVTGKNIKTNKPKWFINEKGVGAVIEASNSKQKLSIKIIKDGKLQFSFRGQDKKNSKGVRMPVWIDYKSIKIDGKEILSSPIKTWHDEPYRYEMEVKDGQTIGVEIKQTSHEYTKAELNALINEMYPNLKDLENISNKVYRKFKHNKGLGYLLFHKKKTDTDPSFESRFAEFSSKIKKMQSDMEVHQKELLQKVNEQMTSQINTKLEKVLSQMSKEIEKIQTDVKGIQTELMQKIDDQQSVINNFQAWQTEQSQKTTSKSARIIKFKRSL